MAASAVSSVESSNRPAFLIVSDLPPQSAAWSAAVDQLADIRATSARVLGFEPQVQLASIEQIRSTASETFVLPASFDFGLCDRERLGQEIAEQRRQSPNSVIHHDD